MKSQGLYKKKAGESEKEIGRCYASGFKMGPQAKKCKQALGLEKAMKLVSLKASRSNTALLILCFQPDATDFGFLTSRTVK